MDRNDQRFVSERFLDGGQRRGHRLGAKRARRHSVPAGPGLFVRTALISQHRSARIPDSIDGFPGRKESQSFPLETSLGNIWLAYPDGSGGAVNEE
jgi:hypothetical protein